MATPNRQSKPYTYRTEQEIANNTYDEQYKVETVAPLGYRTDIDSFVPLNIDASGNLNVTSTGGGGGGGTEYTDGSSTIAHPIGTIPVYDKAGTITSVSVANPLPVTANISGSISNTTFASTQSGTWNTGTPSATINVGQTTSAVTAVQLSASSTVPTNGILVQALSTNTASVFIGGSSVLTTTGFELQPGQAVSFTANLNTLYVIGTNASDKVCWNVQ